MVRFIIIRMMYRKCITQFLFCFCAELASKIVALSDAMLKCFTKTWSVFAARHTSQPSGIVFSGKRISNTQTPIFIFGVLFTTFFCCLSLFGRPNRFHFGSGFFRMFPAYWHDTPFQYVAHVCVALWRTLVCDATFTKCRVARCATLYFTIDVTTAINTRPLFCFSGTHWFNLPRFNHSIPFMKGINQ